MAAGPEFRELLAADAALMLGVAEAPDVAAALQRYWARREQPGATFEAELARIADLGETALTRIRAEVERLLGQAGGDAQAALTRHGGLDRSIHLALGKGGGDLTRALSVMGVPIRAPLRTLAEERYVGFEAAGIGGMGVVYAALDTEMNRRVAFKMVRPHAERGREEQTPSHPLEATRPPKDTPASEVFEQLKARLVQEAWVTGGLEHPGIVPVYEIGQTPTGIPYYTMRYVRGERTLADAIREKKGAAFEERLALLEPFLKVCDTLRYAHDKGVVHRDLKPANVALGHYGEVVLLDWGLARLEGREDVASSAWQQQVETLRQDAGFHTLEGGAIGTAGYMAPEAALGRLAEVDARSDVYGLGTMLFEILTGRLPFQFRSYAEYASLLLRQDPPSAREVDPSVPEALSALCARSLAREKTQRPASAQELAEAVRAWQVQDAVEREVDSLLRDARTALESADALHGDARLVQVDRAAAALAQVESKRPGGARARELAARASASRESGIQERARANASRLLRRVALGALAAAAIAAFIVVTVVEGKRKEADEARTQADIARAATQMALGEKADALGQAERERDAKATALRAAEAARGEAEATLVQARSLGLVLASRESKNVDAMRSLLLATEAVRLSDDHISISALHDALIASQERVRYGGHTGWIFGAAFSPDGSLIVTASGDATARIWNVEGKEVATLRGHEGPLFCATFSPAGTHVLTASQDRTARIWDLAGHEVAALRGHGALVKHATFSPNGSHVLTSAWDNTARLWDSKGNLIAILRGHDERLMSGTFSPDGSRILTTSLDNTARLWDLAGKELATLRGHSGWVTGGVFSHDGSVILTASLDGTARTWDLQGREVAVLRGHEGGVTGAIFLRDSQYVLTTSDDSTARVWDLKGEELSVLDGHGDAVSAAVCSPDGTRVLTSSRDNTARLWYLGMLHPRLSDGTRALLAASVRRSGSGPGLVETMMAEEVLPRPKVLAVLRGHEFWLSSAVFSPDGTRALTASFDATARLWDLREPGLLGEHDMGVNIAAFSPDGTSVLAASNDMTARLRSLAGEELAVMHHTWWVRSAVFSPKGNLILTALDLVPEGLADAYSAQLWDTRGKQVAVLRGHEGAVTRTAFSPDGSMILTASRDKTARVWSLDGRGKTILRVHEGQITRASFSPDGTRILTASGGGELPDDPPGDRTARLWALDGRQLAVLRGHEDEVTCAVFSPDGTCVLTGSGDKTARVWSIDGEELVVLRGHAGGISSATFSPDGTRILTASSDGTARIWESDGRMLTSLVGHEGSVTSASYSHDGGKIVTASDDTTARIWDREGRALAILRGHAGAVKSASFSPDGARVVTASEDGRVRTWYVQTDDLLRLAAERASRSLTTSEQQLYSRLLRVKTGGSR